MSANLRMNMENETKTENATMGHLYIPLHIHSFATEREEEPNSCTAGKNFLNVQFQQSGEKNKQKTPSKNQNRNQQQKSWLSKDYRDELKNFALHKISHSIKWISIFSHPPIHQPTGYWNTGIVHQCVLVNTNI